MVKMSIKRVLIVPQYNYAYHIVKKQPVFIVKGSLGSYNSFTILFRS